jgi:flagellar basal body-associated protein FliL
MAKQSTSYIKLLVSGVVLVLILAGVIAAIFISRSGKVSKESAERKEALKEGPVVSTNLAKLSSDAKQPR